MNRLNLCSCEELSAFSPDVVVIGSGPAGVAIAERFMGMNPPVKTAVIERGGILTLTHVNNSFPNELRRPFIESFKEHPWTGDFAQGGMLIPALGGRGIVAGAHLRRFDQVDFSLWKNGRWPRVVVEDLPGYFTDAELVRRVSATGVRGPAQTWALGKLSCFGSHPPPVGVDLWPRSGFDLGRGYDSSAARLWRILIQDAVGSANRSLAVTVNTCVTSLRRCNNGWEVVCTDSSGKEYSPVKCQYAVLAASPVESARLALASKLGNESVGKYLAEHIERRAKIAIRPRDPVNLSQEISIVVPPPGTHSTDRFQVHLRSEQRDRDGNLIVDIGGFAAIDPHERNCVTLGHASSQGTFPSAHTILKLSQADNYRAHALCEQIRTVARLLDGKFITQHYPLENGVTYDSPQQEIQVMPFGRSYHEAGTLRMGDSPKNSATDSNGELFDSPNVFAADAALFPCVGVANPMLTVTALAFRVADKIATRLGRTPKMNA